MRISIVGNIAGGKSTNIAGGKSTLSAKIAAELKLPLWELDSILWLEGWKKVEESVYLADHQKIIDTNQWVVDGLGLVSALASRIARSTHVILVDLPLWQHHWLLTERHLAYRSGKLQKAPGGLNTIPPSKNTHATIEALEKDCIQYLRKLCRQATVPVFRINDADELYSFDVDQLSEVT